MRVGFESLSWYKLKELVAGAYKPLRVENSLPFIISQNGEYKIRWFYYNMRLENNVAVINIERIITLDEAGHFGITLNPQVQHRIAVKTTNDDFNHDEYYKAFVKHLNNKQFDNIQKLLKESECDESLELYTLLQTKYV